MFPLDMGFSMVIPVSWPLNQSIDIETYSDDWGSPVTSETPPKKVSIISVGTE